MAQDRQRQQAIINTLQDRAAMVEVMQFKELLNLLFHDAKDNLVSANMDNITVMQGEARAYQKIIKLLDRPSIARIKKVEENI